MIFLSFQQRFGSCPEENRVGIRNVLGKEQYHNAVTGNESRPFNGSRKGQTFALILSVESDWQIPHDDKPGTSTV